MNFDVIQHFPKKCTIAKLVLSRYPNHARPMSWDARVEGVDVVETADGLVLKLWSDGGQSPPREKCVIMLSSGDAERGYRWTLYGMPKGVMTAPTV